MGVGNATQVVANGGAVAQLQRIGYQGVADRHLLNARHLAHKGGQVVAVQVVASIDAQASGAGGTGGFGETLQLRGLRRRGPGRGIRFGVELHPVGADRVELYTEPYAAAWATPAQATQLKRFAEAARAARAAGLGINAGHDLNRDNLTAFVREVPGVQEVSIGHALIADALELGYSAAVRDYLRCIADAHGAT